MSIILQDPTHLEAPSRSSVRPAAPLDPGSAPEDCDVSFELESPGGYLRTVTGTMAYLDQEAHTYMVRTPYGALIRVPIRDIKKSASSPASVRISRKNIDPSE